MRSVCQLVLGLLTIALLHACDAVEQSHEKTDNPLPTTEQAHRDATSLVETSEANEETSSVAPTKPKLPPSAFKTIEWTDLMPKEDLDAISNPPSYITGIEDGSEEDLISSQLTNTIAAAADDRYQQALISTNIVPGMNQQAIRLPGYIVPVEFDDEQTITEFFFVPWFGACIHLPPPPPNQLILVAYPEGLQVDALYDPFWVSGVLHTSLVTNEIASAAYTMDMHHYELYEE